MTSKFDLNRRQFIGGTLGVSALPLISKPVFAQAKTKLQFQCFGGAYEEILRQDIIPEFEAANNIEVVFTVEDDVQMLPKLIAARDRPVYDVVTLDNPIAFQGKDLWLDNMTSKMPNAKDVYSSSLPPETANYGAIVYQYALVHDKSKLPNVESWMDLWTNDIVVGVPHISQAYGMTFLYIAAMLHGGSATDLKPGIEAIKSLKKFKVYKNVSEGRSLFQQQEVDAALFYSHRGQQLIDSGLNLGRATPKEGLWGQRTGFQIPKTCQNVDGAIAWVNNALSASYQSKFLKGLYSPTNSKVEAPADLEEKLLMGADTVNSIRELDWGTVLPQKDELVDLWVREIG
ncbi:extracellular solute-binding protein [Limibacillus halophilus]|uniref:Putative spermidine/putrescine transport system substrate-binding protein n=1 Tax=Limibacillus halophilus TaxID=1579333 RepID=A0A839SQV1_9PROT|nr:extracellular solute-binding protein [Limibacillus halophilus]MBB3064329.1 putative spermidine/putrescine transport system substrate-binding protein [Limibacillus halophilus]